MHFVFFFEIPFLKSNSLGQSGWSSTRTKQMITIDFLNYPKNKHVKDLKKNNKIIHHFETGSQSLQKTTETQHQNSFMKKASDKIMDEGFIYKPAPNYPLEALKNKLEGDLLLLVKTNKDGFIASVSLEQSSGHDILDSQALQTVKEWRLSSESIFHVPFSFKIKQKPENSIDTDEKK